MKRFLILCAAPLLANCAAIPAAVSIAQAVATSTNKVEVPATQALIVAHNAYQGAAAVATAAVNACNDVSWAGSACGALKPKLPQIAALDNAAVAKLDLADQGIDVAENSAAVMNIVSSIQSLSGK